MFQWLLTWIAMPLISNCCKSWLKTMAKSVFFGSLYVYIYINICVYWYLNRYIYIYIYVLKRLSGQFFYNLEGKNIQYIGDLTCFYLIQIVQFLILHYPVHTVYGYTGNDCQTSRQLCDYIGNYFYTFRQPYGYTINSSLSIVLSLHCLRITYSTEK